MSAEEHLAEMRDERREVDVPRREQVHLLQARDGFGLNDRVLVVLHHRTADEARQARRRYGVRVALEFRSDGRDEGREALAETLVHVDVGRRNAEHELEDERQRRLHVAAKHRTAGVGYQRQRVQRPDLDYRRGGVLCKSEENTDASAEVVSGTHSPNVSM